MPLKDQCVVVDGRWEKKKRRKPEDVASEFKKVVFSSSGQWPFSRVRIGSTAPLQLNKKIDYLCH